MIVLDTHIWIWWVMDVNRLSENHQKRIEHAETGTIGIPAISCFEVAMLRQRGRLSFDKTPQAWFDLAISYPGMTLLPLTADISICAATLPEHHKDPFDRLIIATAICSNAPLITADSQIGAYRDLVTLI
jgi:PIN domain nuclease of toxin-antitoxin system